jgi:hypothetical protein
MAVVAVSAVPAQAAAPYAVPGTRPASTGARAVRPDITQVPCNSGPPTPIAFYSPFNNVPNLCFGGYVGEYGANYRAVSMSSGGYYGHFSYTDANGYPQTIYFRPNEVHGLGYYDVVVDVVITPPF